MAELSNNELLILNTILGYNIKFNSGNNINQLIKIIEEGPSKGMSMTEAESSAFIEAAKKCINNNPDFGNYTIVESIDRIDDERAPIVTFVSPNGDDAVVAFWGTTGPEEWFDNVKAGDSAISGSKFQNVAKDYINRTAENYDTITVTGHSKGGNKAQYVALMCDEVDRCVSFDGQGFSKEFIDENIARINSRKSIITSISAEKDIVNALIGSIAGNVYFVDTSEVPKEYLEGGFLYYHKPNILLNAEGQLYNTDGVEPAKIARLLNEYSVYMSSIENPEHKSKAFEIAAQLARELMGNEDSEAAMSILGKMENTEDVAIFIAYTFEFFESKNMSYDEMTEILSEVGIKIDMWYAPILWNAVFDASKTITADEFIIFAEELQKSASINGILDWQHMLKYSQEDPMRIIEIYSSLDLGKETIHKIVVNLFSLENVSSLISGLIINHPVISGCTVALLTVPAVREILITIAGVAVSLCSIYLISKHIKANWPEIKAAVIHGAEYVKDKVAEMYTALVNKINEEINDYVSDVLSTVEKIITVGNRVIDFAGEKLDDFMGFMKDACNVAIKTLFMLSNPILYLIASKLYNSTREPVRINMVKLRQCVNTMNRLASRVASIDSRLDNLYYQLSRNNIEQGEGIFTSLANMYNLFRADLNVDEGQAIKRKARALSELFEDCEKTDKWVTSNVPQRI